MDAAERLDLFNFVRTEWGPDRAGQLMDLLPPAGAAELVTTDQLDRVAAELRVEMRDGYTRLADRIADQTRTLMIAMLMLWVSGIALSFTAARLAG